MYYANQSNLESWHAFGPSLVPAGLTPIRAMAPCSPRTARLPLRSSARSGTGSAWTRSWQTPRWPPWTRTTTSGRRRADPKPWDASSRRRLEPRSALVRHPCGQLVDLLHGPGPPADTRRRALSPCSKLVPRCSGPQRSRGEVPPGMRRPGSLRPVQSRSNGSQA